MIIQDVVDTARYSELSGSSLKDNVEAIILFLNAGLLELHKRFQLDTNEHIITVTEGVDIYPLPEDFLHLVDVYGEVVEGSLDAPPRLPVNDNGNPYSVFLPSYKELQVPRIMVGDKLSVIYAAVPTTYTVDDLGVDLQLPPALIEPLLHYIGYKAHLGIRGDAQAETNTHYLRFDRSCSKARELGIAQSLDSWEMDTRLRTRGFV